MTINDPEEIRRIKEDRTFCISTFADQEDLEGLSAWQYEYPAIKVRKIEITPYVKQIRDPAGNTDASFELIDNLVTIEYEAPKELKKWDDPQEFLN